MSVSACCDLETHVALLREDYLPHSPRCRSILGSTCTPRVLSSRRVPFQRTRRAHSAPDGPPIPPSVQRLPLWGIQRNTCRPTRSRVAFFSILSVALEKALVPLAAERLDSYAEISSKLLRTDRRIRGVPTWYCPRTRSQGKSFRETDGIDAIWPVLKNHIIESHPATERGIECATAKQRRLLS